MGVRQSDLLFDDFYSVELPKLLAVALGLTGSREVANDVVHETFLRAYRRWDRVSLFDSPGGWARRVLINLATDVHRRSVREGRALTRIAGERQTVFGEPDLDRFWETVRTLPERQRAVVALRYADDLAVETIAAVLAISVGAVTKSLFVARKTLAAQLQLEMEDGR